MSEIGGEIFPKNHFERELFFFTLRCKLLKRASQMTGDASLSASHSLLHVSRKHALLARGVVSPFPQKVSSKKKKERNGRPRKKNASTKKRRARLCAKRNDYYYSVPCVREACLRNSFFSILRVLKTKKKWMSLCTRLEEERQKESVLR